MHIQYIFSEKQKPDVRFPDGQKSFTPPPPPPPPNQKPQPKPTPHPAPPKK